MTPVTLLYHDVIDDGNWNSSGFAMPGSDLYKLDAALFREHLRVIRRERPDTVLTFDDGGASACRTCDMLEAFGFRGIFFIATDWIGQTGFLDASQIRSLRRRGHRIGTHSCSHPDRISRCSWDRLLGEWTHSAAVLGDILGEPVLTASVPGGFYTRRVAEAAAAAGIPALFTSEPTLISTSIAGCTVTGRYTIKRSTSTLKAAALARGDLFAQVQQQILWSAKKMAKAVGGKTWLRFRKRVLKHNHEKRR